MIKAMEKKQESAEGMPGMGMVFFHRLIRNGLMTRGHLSKDLQVVKKLAMKLVGQRSSRQRE